MKKNGKNEELQSRREFFKRAAKGALPILAGAALLSSPILSETANAMSCAGCNNRCMNSCFNTLKSYIYNSVAELRERKYVMAKIQLLAVISIDGCPMKLHPRKRLLQTEDYGMDEIRANALYKLTSDYSVSVLQEWREEGGSICHLLEVTAGNTEYANGLLRMNVIDEIILYVVPTIDGNGAHFFKSALPMNDWRLMENKTYRDGVIRLTYHKEPRA